jgi:hypothetical protein
MTAETDARPRRGATVLAACIAAFLLLGLLLGWSIHQIKSAGAEHVASGAWGWLIALSLLGIAADGLILIGLTIVAPNTAKVVVLFGTYLGTLKKPGFWWVHPFARRTPISMRTRNMVTPSIKVNDIRGNPVEIGAVVVWRVVDTARATFDVDSFKSFVDTQCESALRHLASSFPYDTGVEHETSLRGSPDEVSKSLTTELQERVAKAGVTIEETRLSHLAYAPEIAGAMLRRQQADAIVAARLRIVEGAVGMVESALEHLEKGGKVNLDDERRAAMVSNLMVVLCGDHSVQPVVNTGTLYNG